MISTLQQQVSLARAAGMASEPLPVFMVEVCEKSKKECGGRFPRELYPVFVVAMKVFYEAKVDIDILREFGRKDGVESQDRGDAKEGEQEETGQLWEYVVEKFISEGLC
jgi:hypothetical protein